jgi:para-nitrobenzyl esterase
MHHFKEFHLQNILSFLHILSTIFNNLFVLLNHYQTPPVGDLRWRVPEEFDGFSSEKYFNATAPGFRCPQSRSGMGNSFVGMNEDCLNLNVEIPLHLIDQTSNKLIKPENLLNVMVFIHGGAFSLGSGVDPYINAEEYAKRDIILVACNYRLGILGFFTLPEILQEDPNAYNFGLLDQRMAISWVKKYIEHFGGDKKQITLFGESAGAMSILWQLSAVEEKFPSDQQFEDIKGVIIQSAADTLTIPCEAAVSYLPSIQEVTGCYDIRGKALISCLKQQSAELLINALPDFAKTRKVLFHTLSEGVLAPCTAPGRYPLSPREAIHKDEFNNKPNVIIGTCKVGDQFFILF